MTPASSKRGATTREGVYRSSAGLEGRVEVAMKNWKRQTVGLLMCAFALCVAGSTAWAEEAGKAEQAADKAGDKAGDKVADKAGDDIVYYTVAPGDTLGSIALRYKVSVLDLQDWNEMEGLAVEPDTTIIVKGPEIERPKPVAPKIVPMVHVVRRGDTFEAIARRYRVTVAQVQRWNRRVNPRRLQIGQEVRLHVPHKLPNDDGRSVSYGAANGGRLYNGVRMTDSPGLRIRTPSRAYATDRTILLLQAAGADVKARWPDAPDMLVGSLSAPGGGRLRPHKSHQSGRDVDLAYYHRGNFPMPEFRNMTAETFDAVKNWHFFKILIDSGEVEYLFVDYRLQKILYDYALSIGYTPEELEPLIQYPNGQGANNGIIRHSRGHLNHVHIRFKCGPRDRNCR